MNISIVIALPKIEDAKKIRASLNRYGFTVASVCNTGANALSNVNELDGGILICGYHLADMYYRDVLEYLPEYVEFLLLASARVIGEAPSSVESVEMPMKVADLIDSVSRISDRLERRWKRERRKPRVSSEKEQNYIMNAKRLLMEQNHLSEEEAYRYIQKCSMDSGTNMVETAQMLMMLMYDSG